MTPFFNRKEVECHKTCFFEVPGENWQGPQGTGSAKLYSLGNRGVKNCTNSANLINPAHTYKFQLKTT